MPSKGVQCYSYTCVPGTSIQFSVPGKTITKSDLRAFGNDHLEVDKKSIKGAFNFTGTFSFTVTHDGRNLTTQSVNINVLTGNLEGGTLREMEDQQSVLANGIIITYGYYDAGPGVAGLPSSDQCYVTVSSDYSSWMSQVAPPGSSQAGQPFSKLFLPAAHDVGMNSMQNSDLILSSNAIVDALISTNPTFAKIAGMMSHDAVMAIAPNIVRGLAITQKDTLPVMLALGCRYFEFRPAFLHNAIRGKNGIPDVLYFSHSAIPGMAYQEFLRDVVVFLAAHPDEIVVTQLRWDGVPSECAHPSDDDLRNYMNTALQSGNGLIQGSVDDMLHLSIQDLRNQNKRLILFTPTDSYSTYTDEGNATLNGDSIIAQFNQLTPERQAGKPFTNLQCQATASNIRDAVVYSVLAANASSSCLLATKPICDGKTLPWIVANAGRLDPNQLVVAMNDFFDGATADVCIEWSRRRLA